MEEKLVKVLLDQYKERGVDLYALLDNKLFVALPIEKKVNLIKQYASQIKSGTSKGLTKKDISSLIFETAFAGVTSGMLAHQGIKQVATYFPKVMAPKGVVLGAIALGAGVSGLAAYAANSKVIKNKAAILKKLDSIEQDSSDENAIKLLTARGFQVDHTPSTSVSSATKTRLSGSIGGLPRFIMGSIEPYANYKAMQHNGNNNMTPYAPGVTDDHFLPAYEASSNRFLNRIKAFASSSITGV